MTFIDMINKLFCGFIVIYNAEERKVANAKMYHSGRKEFYNATNPYMDIESFKKIDWHDQPRSPLNECHFHDFMNHTTTAYDQSYNPSTGLPMIGAMDISGNAYGTSSNYYQDTYYNHPQY